MTTHHQKLVYLAGPITGLTFKDCTDWRQGAIQELAAVGIKGVSPMRCKDYLEDVGVISGHGREYFRMHQLSTPKGVVTRDCYDVHRSDVLLVNLWNAQQVSIGTMFELAWSFHKRTPIVAVMREHGCLHDHMFVHQAISYRHNTMEDAIQTVKAILL